MKQPYKYFFLLMFFLVTSQVYSVDSTSLGSIVAEPDVIKNGEMGGIIYGDEITVIRIFGEEKFSYPTGHGWAAERGNNLIDRIQFKNARVVGDNNIKNGADRIIINGEELTLIQTKYYNTAYRSINACFDNVTGEFKYLDANNKPMLIEVPADQYEEAVRVMAKKISENKVPGITDPGEAENLVKKGSLTYKQSCNLAKAGTVESLTYDAVNSTVAAASAFGISSVLTYTICIMNGEKHDVALTNAAKCGLQAGGALFLTSILASQLSKAGLNSALKPASIAFVRALGPKMTQFIASSAPGAAGTAETVAAGVVRSQIITGTILFVVLSAKDVVDLFRDRISSAQLIKNLTVTASGIGGGLAGAVGGAAIGTAISPGIGTIVGGLAGGIVGGIGAGTGTYLLIEHFTESDAEAMVKILEEEFQILAGEYLLSREEGDDVVDSLQKALTPNCLKDMYASNNRSKFARELIEPLMAERVKHRNRIMLPTEEEMSIELADLLKDIVYIH